MTESGLQYEIIGEGSGKSPGPKDEVLVNFRGTLIDGTEFDSSEKTYGGPAKFRVQPLIRGFGEALQMMPEGAKWKIYIPSELAYGIGGREPLIGPNAALVFEVELLEVIPNQYEYKRK
jgi:FKBP-type peptidyl-prolyl cis-trans isomerase